MSRGSGTTWFFGDDALREIAQCLTSPDAFWDQNRQIDVVVALEELAAWSADSRDYDERMHKSGWASAAKDFATAYDALGLKVKSLTESAARPALGLCAGNLGPNADEVQSLRESLATLREVLALPDALAAAWDDLVATSSKQAPPIDSLDSRRDAFWAIARVGDRNVKELADRLRGVLSGDPLGFYVAERHLGEVSLEPAAFEQIRQRPIADPRTRMELARRLLRFEPSPRRHVVWLGFRDAGLHPSMVIQGDISLYDGQYLHSLLAAPPEAVNRVPEELRELHGDVLTDDEHDVVLARIDLGVGRFPDAIGLASNHAAALIAIAAIRGGGKPWKQMSGYLHAEDGRITTHQSFVRNEFAIPYSVKRDGTALSIGEVVRDLTGKLTLARSELREIVEALHWWQSSAEDRDAKSVLLNVRLIELVAARTGETAWTTFLEKYFKNTWIQHVMKRSLHEAFNDALHTSQVNDGSEAAQRRIRAEVIKYGPGGYNTFDIATALHAAERIEALLPPRTTTARAVRTVRRKVADPRSMVLWARNLEADWSAAVHRLERIRNSIMHGGPFTDAAVTRVHSFSHQLSAWSVVESMDAVLEQVTVRDKHISTARRMDRWRQDLATTDPSQAVFIAS
ncbi:hypothetical protein [Micromonospora aurantiaca]|uniref:Apea-like HEPN domain-containing protein n=1 Tax=Micromonospora aurantiaca (nom. illeg.) TaxID=47850 RepID=A0ABQ6UKM1_9ACTN|nr:hypothetical protein [Micromonospora aurantiaca]KAB1117579.1 hypothetical protein F6X54_07360 [Micromonospora aurantiaca]UFN93144.1 hypothetical protein LF814_24640 [Micromonospora aurantiaca]